jgi:hypothetical protein
MEGLGEQKIRVAQSDWIEKEVIAVLRDDQPCNPKRQGRLAGTTHPKLHQLWMEDMLRVEGRPKRWGAESNCPPHTADTAQ